MIKKTKSPIIGPKNHRIIPYKIRNPLGSFKAPRVKTSQYIFAPNCYFVGYFHLGSLQWYQRMMLEHVGVLYSCFLIIIFIH